jgi:hypothetical protein
MSLREFYLGPKIVVIKRRPKISYFILIIILKFSTSKMVNFYIQIIIEEFLIRLRLKAFMFCLMITEILFIRSKIEKCLQSNFINY